MAASSSFATCTAGDPLLWPAYIRHTILLNICIFVFMGNMYTAGIATGFQSLAADFHVSFSRLSDLVAYPVLALGVGNIIWTPTSVVFGKRPVIIASNALFLACTIWSIKAKSVDSLLASRVFASFGAGSIESIGPAIIADLYSERYYATSMALFALFLSGGSQVGPMIAGFLVTHKGWRWFFILSAILIAANLVLMIFLLPETTYVRFAHEGETTAQEADKDADEMYENVENARDVAEGVPHASPSYRPYAGSYWKDLVDFKGRGMIGGGLRGWPRQFSLPFQFLLVPHALFASVSYGILLAGTVLISTLSPQLFGPPPYLLTSSGLGLFSLGSFVGIIVSYPIAGPLTDILSRAFAGHGHAPEHRMPALIMPFLICPAGLLLYAYIVAEKKSIYVAAVGAAMQTAGLVFVPSVVLSVVIDAWPANGYEAVVLINAIKNAVAFAVTKAAADWLSSEGLKHMFWEMAAIQWAILGLALPLYFFGAPLRRASSRWARLV